MAGANYDAHGARGLGFGTLVFISALVSAVVSICTVYVVLRWGGAQAALAAVVSPASDSARVPNVVGMRSDAADELLTARKLRLIVREQRADDSVPAGAVIEQTPLGESRVESGGAVSVVVSTGSEKPKVPDLLGKTLEDAQHALEGAGLKPGPVSYAEQGTPGTVTAAAPDVGTALAPGTSVALTVARPLVEVPRVINVRMSEARETIEKAGLAVGDVSEIYNSRHRGNVVLSQDPEPGTKLEPGAKIKLVINQGD